MMAEALIKHPLESRINRSANQGGLVFLSLAQHRRLISSHCSQRLLLLSWRGLSSRSSLSFVVGLFLQQFEKSTMVELKKQKKKQTSPKHFSKHFSNSQTRLIVLSPPPLLSFPAKINQRMSHKPEFVSSLTFLPLLLLLLLLSTSVPCYIALINFLITINAFRFFLVWGVIYISCICVLYLQKDTVRMSWLLLSVQTVLFHQQRSRPECLS